MSNLLDKYLFQALDAYPYNLEEAVESLNYALSYDEKNPIALSLLGQIYAENLKNYEVAKEYYQQALAEDMYALDVYPKYINVLLWNEDYEEVEKLIDFALTVKGTDKAMLHLRKGILFEQKKDYKKALKCLKLAKENAYNNHFINDIKEEEERIKNKMPKKKKSKDKSSSKKSKKKS
ncbi:tetratricopeptide repeat protein [Aquimarina macrocephali]|uniref:tetratricopeptide repeat protein n=1 Tax=Aquimarina macrocephali TaxID=666563 RepID=UPI0004662301|nr:tetratricopeptide repeat protein [Aquimarina macrocephali]